MIPLTFAGFILFYFYILRVFLFIKFYIMAHFSKIIRWIATQEHLYFLFSFLLVVPNFVFFVTEPLPLSVGLAAILMPLACVMWLLLIFRKPGIMVWILLPKFILDGGQLILLYLFGESVVAVDMFLNLTSSNASEASELIGNIFIIILCVLFLYTLPTLILAYRSARLRNKLSSSFRKKWAMISLAIFVMGGISYGITPFEHHNVSFKNDIYPANALYNLYFAIGKAEKNNKYPETSANFSFQARKDDKADKREIVVLVVGETSRAMEWSLYGYQRKTTPRLEKLGGLVHFTNTITQSNNTHKSVPIILSAASAENYEVIYHQKSIVTAFKEAGFKTLVIANQKLTTSMIGSFYREADEFIDLSTFKTGTYLTSLHDGAVIPYVEKAVKDTKGDLFIVLHTYGSHFNYHERYPKEFAIYKPDKVVGIRASYKQQLRNAYDNSICYTDYVLSELANFLAKTGDCTSMVYLSDHGEDIFDDGRARYLHASPIPTYYQLHIPYIIWFSDAYRATWPEKYQAALSHKATPVSTNSVFHTVLDLGGVITPEADSSLMLTRPDFVVRERMYLGDHDDPVPFWKIGLKEDDFLMLDKWHITYGDR